MEREQHPRRGGRNSGSVGLPELPAPRDVSAEARDAVARAAEVAREPVGIEVVVRTTASGGGGAARLVATPDTTVREVMQAACGELGLPDRERYALVYDGETLEDPMALGDVPRGRLDQNMAMRLVRRPEAGAPERATCVVTARVQSRAARHLTVRAPKRAAHLLTVRARKRAA